MIQVGTWSLHSHSQHGSLRRHVLELHQVARQHGARAAAPVPAVDAYNLAKEYVLRTSTRSAVAVARHMVLITEMRSILAVTLLVSSRRTSSAFTLSYVNVGTSKMESILIKLFGISK